MRLETEPTTPNNTKQSTTLGIRGRLLVGFGVITLIFLIAISITLSITTTTKNFASSVLETDLPTYNAFLDLGAQIYETQSAINGFILTNDNKFKADLNQSWSRINQLTLSLDALSKNWMNAEINKKWELAKSSLERLKLAELNLINFSNTSNKDASVAQLSSTITPLINSILEIFYGSIDASGIRSGGIHDLQYAQLENGTHTIMKDMNAAQITEISIIIIGIFFSLLVSLLTARNIIRHINIFRIHSSRIASGDLRQELEIESNDEIGLLGKDLNNMTHSLATIAKQITLACHNMVTTLEQVKQAADVQSSGASEQASSINEITASLSEIEKSSTQTMEKAKMLGTVAEKTRDQGQQGLNAVEQSIIGMNAIRDKVQMIAQTILDLSNQTQQVGEITSVVNRLAQQSKMLALNASIEAAKAGEAGKGFAVVASEVKTLAEQSEQSTSQVQKILEDIRRATEKAVMVTEEGTKGVEHGTGLVEQTGEIVRKLSEVIHETTLASQQIEAAVRQESIGIEQITAGMNEINQVTSSFVASAQQTIEAIKDLADIAKNLKEHVDTYQV